MKARVLVGILTLVFVGGLVMAQDDKAKGRGTLPANYGKLGLSDEQKTKVYEIQGKFKSKIDSLRKELSQLEKERDGELVKVLTDGQRTRLREILTSKVPDDKPEKK